MSQSVKAISAVIINRNNLSTLPACLAALRALPAGSLKEVLVVDMASTDKSREWLEAQSGIQVLRLVRHSWPRAANMGARAANGDRILLLSGHVVPEGENGSADWLKDLSDCLAQRPDAAIVGGRLITPAGRILSEGRSFISGLGLCAAVSDLRITQPDGPARPEGLEPQGLEVDGVDGRLMLFTREIFEKNNGFDESYQPCGTADDDFCFGARAAGRGVLVCPSARGVCYEPFAFPGMKADPDAAAPLLKREPIREGITREHALIWEEKWGINPLFVDLSELRRIYGATRVCWKLNDEQRFRPSAWPVSVDLCMAVWNSVGHLDRCLESLAATDYPAHLLTLYVVDNGSTDATVQLLESWAGRLPFALKIHCLHVNTGAVPALNLAMGLGTGEIVVKMDDDIRMRPDWLTRLTERFRQRPFAGVVGAKILDDSPEERIQCGPISQPPFENQQEGRADEGQLDQAERCMHVRGCCCLYRRDALKRSGPLDVRFAPSQLDDVDHHVAFWLAGYEVIYDGGVTVWHKRSTGGFLTRSMIGSASGNVDKLYAKWSARAFSALDIAINRSAEGRLLPRDPLVAPPVPSSPNLTDFPRRPNTSAQRAAPICQALGDLLEDALVQTARQGDPHLYLCRQHESRGETGLAFNMADAGLGFCPTHAPLLREFSAIARQFGNLPLAEATARRAASLGAPAAEPQARLIPALSTPQATSAPDGSLAGRRILIGCAPEAEILGAGRAMIRQFANALRALGAFVQEWSGQARDLESPDGRPYDVVHLFGLEPAFRTAEYLRAARALNPAARVIFSPLLADRGRAEWARQVLPRLFQEGMAERGLEARLTALARGQDFYGVSRAPILGEPHWGHREILASCLSAADRITFSGKPEQDELRRLNAKAPLLPLLPILLPAPSGKKTGAPAPDFGSAPFALTAGILTPGDNLLNLCVGLQAANLRLAHIGPCPDPGYPALIRRLAPGAQFFPNADEGLISAALDAAALFAAPGFVPSWPLLGLAAASRGKPVLLADGQPELQVLGKHAFAADPYNAEAMALALRQAAAESADSARLAGARASAEEYARPQRLIELYTA